MQNKYNNSTEYMYIMCIVGTKCFAAAGPGPLKNVGPGPMGPGPAAAKHLAPTMHIMYIYSVLLLYLFCICIVFILY